MSAQFLEASSPDRGRLPQHHEVPLIVNYREEIVRTLMTETRGRLGGE